MQLNDMKTKIGIVILNFNTSLETLNCVESIKKNCPQFNSYNFYIVDNGSVDDSVKIFKSNLIDPNITIISSDNNLGFSGGNNLGLKRAIKDECRYVFLLNSDIEVMNDCFEIMVDILQKNKKIGSIGPYIVDSLGQYSQIARRGITVYDVFFENKIIRKILSNTRKRERFIDFDKNKDFAFSGMTHGCFFGLTSEFICKEGYLDDNVFLYCEEDIIAYKIVRSNMLSYVSSAAKVKHLEGKSTSKITNDKLCFYRFHRWSSALYVIYNYSENSKILCYVLGYINIIRWILLSIVNKNYRMRLADFIQRTFEIL